MFDPIAYREFIAGKAIATAPAGFSPAGSWSTLFTHQRRALDFACEQGRAAAFLDTGLGKSQLEGAFAEEARIRSNRPSLILTPLAVAKQMQRECAVVGVEARIVREPEDVGPGVNIANYERIGKLDLSQFGGIVLDESSILKSFGGSTKIALVRAFAATPYRLAATATPAPNDHMELGTHSEFLGYLGSMEMLCRWFVNDTSTASQDWRLKGHAEADFWAWVASWARAAALPSDLGGEDAGFILPPLRYEIHGVAPDLTEDTDGLLFRIPDQSATSIHKEKRLTLADRVARAAEIANATSDPVLVWCETNGEGEALAAAIPDAINVHGSMTLDQKEDGLDGFATGKYRVLISKPKLAGFGLNYQHCNIAIFASISHSYEQHYQAVRRLWRFGQKRSVTAHMVIADTERPIWANVQRKAADHDRMKRAMAKAMVGAQRAAERKVYTRPEAVTLPKFMRGHHAA